MKHRLIRRLRRPTASSQTEETHTTQPAPRFRPRDVRTGPRRAKAQTPRFSGTSASPQSPERVRGYARRHPEDQGLYCKSAFRGPETRLAVSAALSRRKGPFRTARGWVLSPATSGVCWRGSRSLWSISRAEASSQPTHFVPRTWCFDRGLLLGPSRPPSRRDRPCARGDRRVVGRVRARVNSKTFTLTELTRWADGTWVEDRGVAAACINYYFWANRGLVNVGEVRGRTKALFDRVGKSRHHGPHSD